MYIEKSCDLFHFSQLYLLQGTKKKAKQFYILNKAFCKVDGKKKIINRN
jgi:hypothetical protein